MLPTYLYVPNVEPILNTRLSLRQSGIDFDLGDDRITESLLCKTTFRIRIISWAFEEP